MRNVYFVVAQKHLRRQQPELAGLLDSGQEADPALLRPDFHIGIDCWVLKTWSLLLQHRGGFNPKLATRAVPGEVCVFHYEHARSDLGVHECFAVVVQADRPSPPLADIAIVQNKASQRLPRKRFIPLWTQDGLIPRNASRGRDIRSIAFMGDQKYVPPFFQDREFLSDLAALGVRAIWRKAGEWHDYSDVDLVLAWRKLPKAVEKTKPASKLVNAWLAGVPALLGREAAYTELRQSPLDYLEVNDGKEIIKAVSYLQENPDIYSAMADNGFRRAVEFSDAAVCAAWNAMLEDALRVNEKLKRRATAPRLLLYKAGQARIHLWKRFSGWRD